MLFLETIDVVLCTYNSNKPYFERCLKSIKREIPLHHLIVIDKFSTDGTLDVIKQHFKDPIIIRTKASLAEARKISIDLVDTRYFAFIDDDVELHPNWFPIMTQNMDLNIGAIHGNAYPVYLSRYNPYRKWLLWSRKRVPRKVIDINKTNLFKRIRGYTHNTIVLTQAVKDWIPPRNIHAYEDWLLQKHLVRKGYVWRIIHAFTAKHYSPRLSKGLKEHFQRVKWNSANARITGFTSGTFQILKDDIKQSIKALKASIDCRDPYILLYIVRLISNYTIGHLKWDKYVMLLR